MTKKIHEKNDTIGKKYNFLLFIVNNAVCRVKVDFPVQGHNYATELGKRGNITQKLLPRIRE